MRRVKLVILVAALAIVFSMGPAYAGKSKTNSAWNGERNEVQDSIKDKSALAKVDALNDKLNDAYGLDRSDYYKVAAKVFAELTKISAANNGPKVKTPDWLGH